jgi:hypothetical protein
LKGYLERLQTSRISGGVVLAYLWKGKLYCSTKCILLVNDFVWEDSREGREIEREGLHRWLFSEEEKALDSMLYLKIQPRGRWNLSRYRVVKFYRQDVAHFLCPGCGEALRVPKSKKEREAANAAYLAERRAKNKAYRDGLKARRAKILERLQKRNLEVEETGQ